MKIILIIFVFCLKSFVAKSSEDVRINCPDLKIGLIAPLSGEYSEYGNKVSKGVELAIAKFNSKYNTNIALIKSDTDEDVKFIEEIANDKKAVATIGPILGSSIYGISKLANERKVPVITPTALYLEKIQPNAYFFKNVVSPDDEGKTIAKYAILECKKKKFAVLHSNDLYSKYCADSFIETVKKLGGEILKVEKFEEGTYDFKEQMLSLGGIDPHIIKDIIKGDKQNLESIINKLVNQINALINSHNINKVVILLFQNIGKGSLQVREDFNYGEIIAKKISYGLAKIKNLEIIEMAKVYKFIEEQSGNKEESRNKEEICKNFEAQIIITGKVIEKNPLSYTVEVTIETPLQNKKIDVSFDFIISDTPSVNQMGIEAIYLPLDYVNAESLISHLLFYDLRLTFLGNSKWQNDKFIKSNKSNLNGAIWTSTFYIDSNMPLVIDFIEGYREKNIEEPDYLSSCGYDTANLILQAIKEGSCNKEDVRSKLCNMKDITGVNGITSFVEGEFKKDLHILTIKDSKVLEIK